MEGKPGGIIMTRPNYRLGSKGSPGRFGGPVRNVPLTGPFRGRARCPRSPTARANGIRRVRPEPSGLFGLFGLSGPSGPPPGPRRTHRGPGRVRPGNLQDGGHAGPGGPGKPLGRRGRTAPGGHGRGPVAQELDQTLGGLELGLPVKELTGKSACGGEKPEHGGSPGQGSNKRGKGHATDRRGTHRHSPWPRTRAHINTPERHCQDIFSTLSTKKGGVPPALSPVPCRTRAPGR